MENEDLLINSSPGEPSLFADAPSPGSLLADDTPSQDTPPSGCVDLSFLEEALLSSPDGGGGPEVGEGGTVEAPEEEEACDILRQSLQEADITEQTLALEAGLALPGDGLSLYNTPGTLAAPLASQFLSKPLSTSPLPAMPRDTQAAVEPPQPSLLAVGPGCPSLKPAAPQLMGLLPGTVFPGTPPEASLSLSPAQGSGMLIQKALPSLTNRPLMTATLRATAAPGILLPRGPLPIQPKLPVNIQPRLVQISPKPAGQKTSQSLTLVQGTASPNILLSPPLGPKPPAAAPQLSKPVSLQLLNQGGSIVIQPQGIFPGHNQFLVPSQTPVTVPQPASAAPPLLTPASQPGPSVRGGASASGHLMDTTQILTAPPRQLNFSPVFTTPTGQLALRQGTLLSGPLQLQSTPPAVFQMPTQLTGTYAPQSQGPRGTLLQSTALGGHITLINSPGMLPPDVASISIVNGPSVVQGVPFAAQAQRPVPGGSEGQQGLAQTSVLLLPETASALEEKSSGTEQLLQVPQHLHHHASQTCPPELQSSPPVVTIVPPQMDVPLHHDPASSLTNHLLPPADGQQVLDGVPSSTPPKHNFIHHLQQVSQALELPSPSAVTLQVQVAPLVSPLAGQRESSTPTMPPAGQAGASTVTAKPRGVTTPTHPGTEQMGTRCSPLIGQGTLSTPPATFSSPAAGQTGSLLGAGSSKAATLVQPSNPVHTVPSPLPVSISVVPQQPTPLPVSAGPQLQTEPTTQQHSQGSHIHVLYRFQQQLCLDHGAVLNPDARSPFLSMENAVKRLLPYHTCAGCPPSQSDFLTVDKQFEVMSALLLKRTKDMLNKYRQLLLGEAQTAPGKTRFSYHLQQVSPSAEMVMLERLFLQAERGVLGEERRKARLEPGWYLRTSCNLEMVPTAEAFWFCFSSLFSTESFLASLRETATGAPFLQLNSPPSPPSWALLSDRPPGLKTYRSSCRGALKLTIKHESGSRKVVHNSACDAAHVSPSGHKQDGADQQTNGGDTPGKHGDDHQDPPCTQTWNQSVSGGTATLESVEDTQQVEYSSTHTAPYLQIVPDPQPTAGESSTFDPTVQPPQPKRPRPDPDQDQTCLPSQAEDHTLNEHLQSAIDSILELQRLQGPPGLQTGAPRDGASVLEQAVSSILEGQR
ncbi:glioma tumor suppressor candidate region protein 1-like [Scleropages formosus]|uniref:Glioma tumor suppressor candidate region protein 1-like n=1 Tax=Scleropages formosus TaxID=113540 RepID=A0A0P7UIP4_SCLFO|nr:glioma tumor suppressor candidate region protein 1-like [Scleropages formosus]